ncbi:unnamed protein product [Phyllotreta striolata]|uniref:Uncharacterized protein n=1 Tax=Phyllotreta striolata TaxID=444603 RepID=A0A9N9TLE4_PHYSR|nr:unnamed protein product [Phyllotreta striolata]
MVNFDHIYHPVSSSFPTLRKERHNERVQLSKLQSTGAKNSVPIDDPCEVIHIGVICSGYNSNLLFHTLIKSIFFNRINPLQFHIVTNKVSEKILKVLFETWDVPQVNVTFYDLNKYVPDVRWIPNSHYSGIHGLLKLIFPKIIPLEVTDRIIVLDTDMTVVADIYELWKMFRKFNEKQAIGMVENQSDYYLGEKKWPAIGRGFNSGVLLYNNYLLKKLNWPKLWSDIAKKAALYYGPTRLADQDIINTVIKENPELIFEVPCVWNTQLSDRTLSESCYKQYKVKIVHWNSPKKYNVENKDGEYFRSLAIGFQEYNGNLLRKKLQVCGKATTNPPNVSDDICSEFHNLSNMRWRTLLYFREYKYVAIENDVTFVAQLSFDRLQTIEELVKAWAGPISFTLYVSDPELLKCIAFIANSDVLKERMNIAYHAVFKEGVVYPINILRNVGLRNVQTDYVFLADIDFLPSNNLYESLIKYIAMNGSLKKKALIVPAFEAQTFLNQLPSNKEQLLEGLSNKSIIPFLSTIWAPGHTPTMYDIWKNSAKPYKVKWEVDYEPYIVVRSDVVEYDENFIGFGWNKVSHIMELEAQNYEFTVLPDVFIIHKTHTPSYDLGRFRTSSVYRLCLRLLKEQFIKRLNKQYDKNFSYNTSAVLPFIRRKRHNSSFNFTGTTIETNTDYPNTTEC